MCFLIQSGNHQVVETRCWTRKRFNIYVDALLSKFKSCSCTKKKQQKKLQSHKNMEFQRPASGLVTAGYVTKQTRFRFLTSGASGFVTQKEDTCVGFTHSNMIYGLLFF